MIYNDPLPINEISPDADLSLSSVKRVGMFQNVKLVMGAAEVTEK